MIHYQRRIPFEKIPSANYRRDSIAFQSVIFDLDGTLVQSLPGIEQSARVAISRVLPEMPLPDLRAVIGPPIATMFARLWPDLAAEQMACLLAEFRTHYYSEGCLCSEPYPQVRDTLARLQAAGRALFVLTNKPAAPAQKILHHLGLAEFFTEIMGPDSVQPPFRSKPDGARLLAAKHRLSPQSTVIVGDGIDDAEASQACGFGFIAVCYGYGRAAEWAGAAPLAKLEKISNLDRILL